MVVRLRPLNTILYRIRHNLHLMRNSLVAINTVSSLERLGNDVLDSTLHVFLKPDAETTDDSADSGNLDINLDRNFDTTTQASSTQPTQSILNRQSLGPITTTTTTTTTTSTTTSTTTPAPSQSSTNLTSSTIRSTSRATRPPSARQTRRPNNRQNNRRTTQRATSASSLE